MGRNSVDSLSKFERLGFAVIGSATLAPCLLAFHHGSIVYSSWGGLVFAPIFLLFGIGAIAVAIRPGLMFPAHQKGKHR